ncbi:ABC transporter permease [Gehongia tenuis]|uniref:Transport permease protein n=1 Tax=Gehongia tenuis TaxID=2763655 RepID=A0A926D2V8_9FIRM|nr:ABC transporter permease [Gehongia tenuis]MBC8530753.1 ABC transporter permease [Gehongia tenuis]
MRFMAFAARNRRELMRDPLSLIFGVGFPVVLILLITLMNRSIEGMPAEIFGIQDFAPGMAIFGLSFISLFLGTLIAGDRSSSYLMRLFASPLTGLDYILGYSLPLVPIAVVQSAVCFAVAALFGFPVNIRLFWAMLTLLPTALLFIAFGILMGVWLTDKQVGGFASILVNVAAWLSGTWFSLDLIGGAFKTVCNLLPFAHGVAMTKAAVNGDFAAIWPNLLWVAGYAAVIYLLAVLSFQRRMRS